MEVISSQGHDKYVGPTVTISYKGKEYTVWDAQEEYDSGALWIEGFPIDNTSADGLRAGLKGNVEELIDIISSNEKGKENLDCLRKNSRLEGKVKKESNLPYALSDFLNDMGQMYLPDGVYGKAVSHEYTPEEIETLTKLKRNFRANANQMMDDDFDKYVNTRIVPKIMSMLGEDKAITEDRGDNLSDWEKIVHGKELRAKTNLEVLMIQVEEAADYSGLTVEEILKDVERDAGYNGIVFDAENPTEEQAYNVLKYDEDHNGAIPLSIPLSENRRRVKKEAIDDYFRL